METGHEYLSGCTGASVWTGKGERWSLVCSVIFSKGIIVLFRWKSCHQTDVSVWVCQQMFCLNTRKSSTPFVSSPNVNTLSPKWCGPCKRLLAEGEAQGGFFRYTWLYCMTLAGALYELAGWLLTFLMDSHVCLVLVLVWFFFTLLGRHLPYEVAQLRKNSKASSGSAGARTVSFQPHRWTIYHSFAWLGGQSVCSLRTQT